MFYDENIRKKILTELKNSQKKIIFKKNSTYHYLTELDSVE